MAEGSSGGIGVLGVLVGALIVVVVGGGLLYATGNLGGNKSSTLKVELPKVSAPTK
jgi:membrane protein DedA with SNARE-associated domain